MITNYRVVNEAIGLAPESEGGGKQLNGMLYNLLNKTFYDSVLMRLRRLTDDTYLEKTKKDKNDRSVISIISLLNDIGVHIPSVY